MRRDERAQSVGIARFLISVVLVGAVLAWIVGRVAGPILDKSEAAATTQKGVQASQWLQTGVDSLYLAFLVIGVFGLVALAVVQRELRS